MGKLSTVPTAAIAIVACLSLVVACASPPKPKPVPSPESGRAKDIVQGTSTPDFPAGQMPAPGPSAKDLVNPPLPQSGGLSGGTPQPAATGPAVSPSPDQPAPGPGSPLTAEEAAFLRSYISRLSYMVYYNDAGTMDPRVAKMAVTQANRYLLEKQGLSVIDFDQIQKNKQDQQLAYQAETGGSIDMIQYLAQKFNADAYVEVDMKAGAEIRNGQYSASAQGSMKIFDTSTASLLGSIAFVSPSTFSPTSADAAIANAVSASVWQAMPRLTEQTQALIAGSLSRGVRYELIVQKTPDAKVASQLERSLARKFREVEKLSFSPGETRFSIFTFQTRGKVESTIYDAASASGLPDAYLVYMRGKSFTFNTGL